MNRIPVATEALDLAAVGASIVQVLVVGLLLGAGIPAIYATALRSRDSTKPGSSAVSIALFSLCVLLALGGIVLIVFGKVLFGI